MCLAIPGVRLYLSLTVTSAIIECMTAMHTLKPPPRTWKNGLIQISRMDSLSDRHMTKKVQQKDKIRLR